MESISRDFNEDDDGFVGNVEGYIVNTKAENLKNWLESEKINDNVYLIIKDSVEEILLLKNININPEYQSQGYGTQVIMGIINENYLSAVILICDNQEEQKKDFILEKFYENIGFVNINQTNTPLMIYPENLGNKIKENYYKNKLKKLGI